MTAPPRIRVTHLATGRSIVGTPDELLEWVDASLPDDREHDELSAQLTQAIYEWESGTFDSWRTELLGVQATALG